MSPEIELKQIFKNRKGSTLAVIVVGSGVVVGKVGRAVVSGRRKINSDLPDWALWTRGDKFFTFIIN